MSDSELAFSVSAFESSGFTASINWYRNLDRNWHLLADVRFECRVEGGSAIGFSFCGSA